MPKLKFKFDVGEEVFVKTDKLKEKHEVLGFTYDSATGFTYKVSSVEVDVARKKIVNGISFYKEDELIKSGKKENE